MFEATDTREGLTTKVQLLERLAKTEANTQPKAKVKVQALSETQPRRSKAKAKAKAPS